MRRPSGYFVLPATRIDQPGSVYALDEGLLADLERLADQQGIEYVVPVYDDARSLSAVLPERVDTRVVANTFSASTNRQGSSRMLSTQSNPVGVWWSSTSTSGRGKRRLSG